MPSVPYEGINCRFNWLDTREPSRRLSSMAFFAECPRLPMMRETIAQSAKPGTGLTSNEVPGVVSRACAPEAYRSKRVLLIVPDGTRTAPVGLLFQALHCPIADL